MPRKIKYNAYEKKGVHSGHLHGNSPFTIDKEQGNKLLVSDDHSPKREYILYKHIWRLEQCEM